MSYQFRTIIVNANVVDNMKLMASTWAECGGVFARALTSNGVTATHYISSGFFHNSVCDMLPYDVYKRVYDEVSETSSWELVESKSVDAQAIVDKAIEEGLNPGVALAQVNTWSASADVSNMKPEDAMAELGLDFLPEDDV